MCRCRAAFQDCRKARLCRKGRSTAAWLRVRAQCGYWGLWRVPWRVPILLCQKGKQSENAFTRFPIPIGRASPRGYCAGKEIEKAGRTMFFRGKTLLNKKRFRILPKPLFCRIALIAKSLSFAIFLSLALEKKIRLEKKPRQGGAVFPGL